LHQAYEIKIVSFSFVTSFSSAHDNSYATPPRLTTLAGSYTGTLAAEGLSESGITLDIKPDGTMTGKISCGCEIKATMSLNGNAYAVSLTFNGGDHARTIQAFAGSAYFDAVNGRLLVVGLLDASKKPAIFVGAKL